MFEMRERRRKELIDSWKMISANTRIFNDSRIVESVFRNLSTSELIMLRPINRTVLVAIDTELRTRFEKMNVRMPMVDVVEFNGLKVLVEDVDFFLSFLRNIRLTMRGINFDEMFDVPGLHYTIMRNVCVMLGDNSLATGLKTVCPNGCSFCTIAAYKSTYCYGPVQINVLRTLPRYMNYTKLYLTQRLLIIMAIEMSQLSIDEQNNYIDEMLGKLKCDYVCFLFPDDVNSLYPFMIIRMIDTFWRPRRMEVRFCDYIDPEDETTCGMESFDMSTFLSVVDLETKQEMIIDLTSSKNYQHLQEEAEATTGIRIVI